MVEVSPENMTTVDGLKKCPPDAVNRTVLAALTEAEVTVANRVGELIGVIESTAPRIVPLTVSKERLSDWNVVLIVCVVPVYV